MPVYGIIDVLHPRDETTSITTRLTGTKNRLMTFRTLFPRLIFICFMVGVGYSLAKSIKYESLLGILLALISLGAGISILYLINRARVAERSGTEEGA